MGRYFQSSYEIVMLLYTMVFMINFTVVPQLITEKITVRRNLTKQVFDEKVIHKQSAEWWLILLTCSTLPSFFSVLIWGPLTDRIGRKIAIVCIAALDLLKSIFYLCNAIYIEANPSFLILGSVLSFLHGDFQGVMMVCYASIADETNDCQEYRSVRMQAVEGAIYIFTAFSAVIAHHAVLWVNLSAIFALNVMVGMFLCIYVSCLSSDTPQNETSQPAVSDINIQNEVNQQTIRFSRLNPISYIRSVFELLLKRESQNFILPLSVVFACYIFSLTGERLVQPFYVYRAPFDFTVKMIGYYTALQSILRGLGSLFFATIAFKFTKLNDGYMIMYGLISQALVLVSTGISTSSEALYSTTIIGFAIPIAGGTIRSVVTKSVPWHSYGTVLASLASIDVFVTAFTNFVVLYLLDVCKLESVHSGSVYFGICTFSLIGLTVITMTYIKKALNFKQSSYETIR